MVAIAKLPPVTQHQPLLHGPWFTSGEGVTLHRFFDDQFVQRFVQSAMSGRLTATRDQSWYNDDRFGRSDAPTLRLPSNQTFYIACCEVSCHTTGQPALDPRRISSAGFVIRRRTASGDIQRWMLQEGQSLGWQSGLIRDQEPDDYRRFVNSKLLQPQYPEPAYSGEETYPMHALLARGAQNGGRTRSHTLLWGYVPLGGSYRVTNTNPNPSTEATNALRGEMLWPFGEHLASNWTEPTSRPVFRGVATQAFHDFLELLLTRYHVFDATDPDNDSLRSQLAAIHFYAPLVPHPPYAFDPYALPLASTRGESLLHWIENSRDGILQWLTNTRLGRQPLSTPLPLQTGVQSDGTPATVSIQSDLYLSEQQAAQLRDALLLRGGRAMLAVEDGLAMPRFAQTDDDLFFIVPFIRWVDDCGCERIHWGAQGSIDFRVVSPFDPEAQRPRAIILPGLGDIKRGAVKGVTMMAPKSLADVIRKIKPDMDMGTGGPGNQAGLCWNFSLSIPVITICAFILLMVVINLLNLFLGWLPWAFLAIPRLCGKLLGENK